MNMLKKSIFAVFTVAALLHSCVRSSEDRIRTGDLIFVGIPIDYSIEDDSLEGAVASSTGSPDSLNLIHVAIAEVSSDTTWIIDATIAHGVDRHPLDTFLTDFTLKDGSLPVFIVKRLKDPSNAAEYVENCKRFLGQPYDVHFLPDNDSLYCSELVRDSYVGHDGNYVFDIAPMNFKDPEGNIPLYWEQLFGLLGQSVPQDVPGTNPQEMSRSEALKTVEVSLDKRY